MKEENVVVRFAPSPTGPFHIGSVRTALFNFLFARKNKGKFLLRIEDTDRERSKPEFEQNIFDSLDWLGLKPDGEVLYQSKRTAVYKKWLEKLIAQDLAYISQETEGASKEVIRFRNPKTKVTFTDLIRGEISFETEELGDFVIAKSLTEPLYHLVVVIDDFESGVTHIIRGEDHISNTPRQILILKALGKCADQELTPANYAHLPLVLAPDRSKLSKRKHGNTVSLDHYREAGYLPEALLNFIALLGWNPGTEQEIFNLEELIEEFSLEKIQKGGAIFNEEKLRWVNKEHLNRLPEEVFNQKIKDQLLASKFTQEIRSSEATFLERLTVTIRERLETFSDLKKLIDEGELDYYFTRPDYKTQSLVWKGRSGQTDFTQAHAHLSFIYNTLETMNEEHFQADMIKEELWNYASDKGRGEVLWPLRFCLSGQDKSPDPFTLAGILGKTETLERLECALNKLEKTIDS